MHKIIVTGASGFIGKNFIEQSQEYELLSIDLLSKELISFCFEGYECVLHLAGIAHKFRKIDDNLIYAINRDLTLKVALKAKDEGVRHFVFMSTVKVYGETTYGTNHWDENTVCNPLDSYALSKLEAEYELLKIQSDNFKVAIIRCPLVYGPGVKANMLRIVKLTDRFCLLPFGNIDNRRSMVYIGNLVAFIKGVIDKSASGIFLTSDDTSISVTMLIRKISISLNKPVYLFALPVLFIKFIKCFKPTLANRIWGSLEVNNYLTHKKLGYSPPYSVDTGIKEMIKWYMKNK